MSPEPRASMARQDGSAVMVALFVIVIMALLAAAMGRFLVDSGEKNTVEVRGVRALMAAQSGLEIGLYRLYPNNSWNAQSQACATIQLPSGAMPPGLVSCEAEVTCQPITVSAAGTTQTGYRLRSEGRCGDQNPSGPNPAFAVNRILEAEAYDGGTP